jgi:hypothetical protein
MPSYHFTVGLPTDLLRIDACIDALTPDAAVAKLKALIHTDVDLTPQGYAAAGGYAQILVNVDAIGVQHIDRVDSDVKPSSSDDPSSP